MKTEIDYESKEIKKWAIYSGLSGGFGGSNFDRFEECTAKEASDIAYENACEIYENYVGSYGLRNIEDIKKEEDIEDNEEAEEVFNEERETWLAYHIEEYDPIKHSKYEK